MAFLPQGIYANVELLLIIGGLGYIFSKREIPKAYGMGMLMLVVFAVDTIATLRGALPRPHPLGFRADEFLAGQAWWSPLTSVFVHAGFAHIIGNLFILVTAGPALEDRIGHKRFATIFFVAAFTALAAHVVLAYTTKVTFAGATAVGASGGIFGVLTAFALRYPRERLPIPLFFIIWMPAFFVLLIFLGLNLFLAFGDTNVAWWGHFTGFLVGLAYVHGLPAPVATAGSRPTGKGLPDATKLAALATTPDLKRILERIRQFTPETRTADDLAYSDAWLGQFFDKAKCPVCAAKLERTGLKARCSTGDYELDFAQAR